MKRKGKKLARSESNRKRSYSFWLFFVDYITIGNAYCMLTKMVDITEYTKRREHKKLMLENNISSR